MYPRSIYCFAFILFIVEDILTIEPEHSVVQLVKMKDKFERTPLYLACASGCFEIANLLIENGASVDASHVG